MNYSLSFCLSSNCWKWIWLLVNILQIIFKNAKCYFLPYKPTHTQRHWYVMHNGQFCCLHLLFCWNYSLCIECLAKPTIEKQRHLILGARFWCNTNKFSSVNIRSSVNLICVVAQKKRLFYFCNVWISLFKHLTI